MKKTTIRVDPLSFIPRRNSKAQMSYQDIISQTVGGTLVIAIILLLLKNLLLSVYVCDYLYEEGGGGGGMEDLAMPIQAITATPSTIHPSTSYLKSSSFFCRCTPQ
jgi:hypothetical protein